MADEEGQEEKKDKQKEGEKDAEDKKDKDGEGKTAEVKRTTSLPKKKGISKTGFSSKSSLKKTTESAMSTPSETSSSSLAMKRQSDFEKMAKVPRYQNTYRLDSKKPFKPDEVYKILETIVLRETEDYPHYDSVGAPKLVQLIAGDVRNSVKLLNYDRYKICVFVYLGEKKLQGFQAAFRALWDHERDGWTTYFYQCRTYFISCTCYELTRNRLKELQKQDGYQVGLM